MPAKCVQRKSSRKKPGDLPLGDFGEREVLGVLTQTVDLLNTLKFPPLMKTRVAILVRVSTVRQETDRRVGCRGCARDGARCARQPLYH